MRRHEPAHRNLPAPTSAADTALPANDVGTAWVMTFLHEHLDGVGRAEVAYARIVSRRHRIDLRSALTIARDVLAGEGVETCEALAVLLDDGWDSALGDALTAARRV